LIRPPEEFTKKSVIGCNLYFAGIVKGWNKGKEFLNGSKMIVTWTYK
jgi:molybdopterin synthase catalytic subunit